MTNNNTMNLDNIATLADMIVSAQKQHYEGEHIPVDSYFEQWLDTKKTIDLNSNAIVNYEGYYRNHIKPYFDGCMLSDISFDMVTDWVKTLKKQGKKPRLINDIFKCVLNPALKEASRRNPKLIPFNPCEGVHLPKVSKQTQRPSITKDELKALGMVAKNHRYWIAIPILAETGMRRGELLGLAWNDMKYDESSHAYYLDINKEYINGGDSGNKPILKMCTKTEAGMRNVIISNSLAKAMFKYRKETQDGKKSFIIAQLRQDKRVDPHNFSRTIATWCKKAGVSTRIGTHAFRHGFATSVKLSGISVDAAMKQAGWKDRRMLDYYANDRQTDVLKNQCAQTMGEQTADTLSMLM
jgi:integrase